MQSPSRKTIITGLISIGILVLAIAAIITTVAAPRSSIRGNDTELLARVIRAEAEAEPFLGQVAVGAVILNRIQDVKFPKTLAGVIYQPQAFESVSNGEINRPATSSTRKAAQDALSGWDPSGGSLFFFNPSKVGSHSYIWTRKIIQKIGKHVFAL
jgi:N-acetylmuramoyl-L-alanine amidase